MYLLFDTPTPPHLPPQPPHQPNHHHPKHHHPRTYRTGHVAIPPHSFSNCPSVTPLSPFPPLPLSSSRSHHHDTRSTTAPHPASALATIPLAAINCRMAVCVKGWAASRRPQRRRRAQWTCRRRWRWWRWEWRRARRESPLFFGGLCVGFVCMGGCVGVCLHSAPFIHNCRKKKGSTTTHKHIYATHRKCRACSRPAKSSTAPNNATKS